jgi:hypothetical protein
MDRRQFVKTQCGRCFQVGVFEFRLARVKKNVGGEHLGWQDGRDVGHENFWYGTNRTRQQKHRTELHPSNVTERKLRTATVRIRFFLRQAQASGPNRFVNRVCHHVNLFRYLGNRSPLTQQLFGAATHRPSISMPNCVAASQNA